MNMRKYYTGIIAERNDEIELLNGRLVDCRKTSVAMQKTAHKELRWLKRQLRNYVETFGPMEEE